MPSLISEDQLHRFATSGCGQADACLAALANLGEPATIAEIKGALVNVGVRNARKWNVSRALSILGHKVSGVGGKWKMTGSGIEWLAEKNLTSNTSHKSRSEAALRQLLVEIKDAETLTFVEECISCLENDLHRSAVVMSWLAAVHVLKLHVHNHHRSRFDAEVKRVKKDWRPASSLDDYGRMREGEFLDRLSAASVIGKNVKAELVGCLDRRNACGHPNSYQLGEATVAHHIETLILNVFSKHC
ncbi:MAG: hypothetical protein AAGK37_15835 [Pseudomonadota bacterium]